MTQLLITGGLGLLFGIAMQLCRLTRREGLRSVAGLSDRRFIRGSLQLLGTGMILTALLCYLAVVDVDLVSVLPLDAGMLVGGALLGLAAGVSGMLPGTAICGVGGGRLLESLCCLAGSLLVLATSRWLPVQGLQGQRELYRGTLFRLTLRDPWLLDGGFLSLACLGVLLCTAAVTVRLKPVPTDAAQELPDPAEADAAAYADAVPEEEAEDPEDLRELALLDGDDDRPDGEEPPA